MDTSADRAAHRNQGVNPMLLAEFRTIMADKAKAIGAPQALAWAAKLDKATKSAIAAEYLASVGTLFTAPSHSAKMVKGLKRGFLNMVLHLAPSDVAGVGNLCPDATVCGKRDPETGLLPCLFDAGRASFTPTVNVGRLLRTWAWYFYRAQFISRLKREVANAARQAAAKGMVLVVRLNGTSDLPWEVTGIMDAFPLIQFVDYTKSTARAMRWINAMMPANYHLVLSASGENDSACRAFLAAGGTVAAAFPTAWTAGAKWLGFPSVDGDIDDIRQLDPAGHVVWLKAKGQAKKNGGNFVQAA